MASQTKKLEVFMKRTILAALMVFITLAMTGCGDGGSSPPPTFVTDISSNPALDGDIGPDFLTGVRIVTQGMTPTVQSVFAGIESAARDEFRAFLDFPLANVPLGATIVSATLHITIDSIVLQSPTNTIPILIELVSFQQPLQLSDFDRAILRPLKFTTISPPISLADVSSRTVIVDIPVDVTLLVADAQNFRLSSLDNFQIRILEDFLGAPPPGLIEINDTTGAERIDRAPLLTVTYF
jgi:hypothetical protein